MNIAIIGAGRIGMNVGKLLSDAKHEVFFSFSRSDEKLMHLASSAGNPANWGTVADAVEFGEVLLLAPPYTSIDAVISQMGDAAGKIIIDCVNPFTSDGPTYKDGGTAAEEIAGKLPKARVIKAYNHIYYQDIANRHHADPPLVAFVSGDDADAKAIITQLVADTGFHVHDLGPLKTARLTEPHGPLFNKPTALPELDALLADLPK